MRVVESKGASWERRSVQEGKGHMGQRESAHGVQARQINAQRERRGMRGMGKREPALVLALESLQYKEGREEGQAKGRQPSKQMVIE